MRAETYCIRSLGGACYLDTCHSHLKIIGLRGLFDFCLLLKVRGGPLPCLSGRYHFQTKVNSLVASTLQSIHESLGFGLDVSVYEQANSFILAVSLWVISHMPVCQCLVVSLSVSHCWELTAPVYALILG